ncbi:ankyrin repeat domain-containing protein [Legionella fallonii]|uniref:Uncharacterized protein n=1 Tax=Legionella fallonii LLAP-10 TaxID=1212491 RepID=A0A098G0E1_9GAMM|nr:ankyrin repeat domain-containing protein [Legionella fallonii]CEG55933.1 protein of unknown function [Ankyrin repeat] [Legionella fallonii LLAP-10]
MLSLLETIKEDNVLALKALLDNELSVDHIWDNGYSILPHAVYSNSLACTLLLLECGANINFTGDHAAYFCEPVSSLALAIRQNNLPFARLLITFGASRGLAMTALDEKEQTDLAALSGDLFLFI